MFGWFLSHFWKLSLLILWFLVTVDETPYLLEESLACTCPGHFLCQSLDAHVVLLLGFLYFSFIIHPSLHCQISALTWSFLMSHLFITHMQNPYDCHRSSYFYVFMRSLESMEAHLLYLSWILFGVSLTYHSFVWLNQGVLTIFGKFLADFFRWVFDLTCIISNYSITLCLTFTLSRVTNQTLIIWNVLH